MKNSIVTYGAPRAKRERKSWIGVKRAVILNICPFADFNPFIVAAKHRAKPNAGADLYAYLSNDDCRICDPKKPLKKVRPFNRCPSLCNFNEFDFHKHALHNTRRGVSVFAALRPAQPRVVLKIILFEKFGRGEVLNAGPEVLR